MANEIAVLDSVAAERPQFVARGESKSIFFVFLELFFSQWMIIGGIFFFATFFSYLALARAPETYEAIGQVMIRRGKVQAVQNVPILRQQEEVGSEVDIMLSLAVLEETVHQLLAKCEASTVSDLSQKPLIFGDFPAGRPANPLKLADLPLTDRAVLQKWLKSQFQIRKFGESNVIEVSLISVNPVFASEAVNTLIDVYEKFNLQVERVPGQTAYFRQEVEKLDVDINAFQKQLAECKLAHGIADLDKERELLTLRRHGSQTELDRIQVDKAGIETDIVASASPKTRMQTGFMRSDMTIGKLRDNVFLREKEIAEMRTKSTEDNPILKQKLEELAALQGMLQREEDMAVSQQRHLYRQIQDKERELESKIAMLDKQLNAFPLMEAEMDRLDREIKQRELKRLDVVEQMIKASTLEDPGQALNKVKVLGYSQVPSFPREARKGFKFLVAVILSGIAAFVAGLFVDGLNHSIRKREEIEEQLNVPYLASLSAHLR